MASSLVDLVKINVSNTGSGAITLGSAVEGYRGRDVLTNGTVYSYSIQQGSAWEFGRGTYLAESAQIIRSVIDSSDGGTALNLKPNAQIAFTALSADLMPQVQLTEEIQAKVDAAVAAQTGAETAQGLSEDARDASVAAKDISVEKAGEAAASAADALTTLADVNAAGATQVGNVNTAGTTQIAAVQAEGTTQTQNVTNAGTAVGTNAALYYNALSNNDYVIGYESAGSTNQANLSSNVGVYQVGLVNGTHVFTGDVITAMRWFWACGATTSTVEIKIWKRNVSGATGAGTLNNAAPIATHDTLLATISTTPTALGITPGSTNPLRTNNLTLPTPITVESGFDLMFQFRNLDGSSAVVNCGFTYFAAAAGTQRRAGFQALTATPTTFTNLTTTRTPAITLLKNVQKSRLPATDETLRTLIDADGIETLAAMNARNVQNLHINATLFPTTLTAPANFWGDSLTFDNIGTPLKPIAGYRLTEIVDAVIPGDISATVTNTNGTATLTVTAGTVPAVGMALFGTGVPAGAYVSAVAGNTVTMSANSTAGVTSITASYVNNFGINGQTAAQITTRATAAPAALLAGFNRVMQGTNDLSSGTPASVIASYASCAAAFTNANYLFSSPWMTGAQAGQITGRKVGDIRADLKTTYGAKMLDSQAYWARHGANSADIANARRGAIPTDLTTDGLHKDTQGGLLHGYVHAAALIAQAGGAPFVHDEICGIKSGDASGTAIITPRVLGTGYNFAILAGNDDGAIQIARNTGAITRTSATLLQPYREVFVEAGNNKGRGRNGRIIMVQQMDGTTPNKAVRVRGNGASILMPRFDFAPTAGTEATIVMAIRQTRNVVAPAVANILTHSANNAIVDQVVSGIRGNFRDSAGTSLGTLTVNSENPSLVNFYAFSIKTDTATLQARCNLNTASTGTASAGNVDLASMAVLFSNGGDSAPWAGDVLMFAVYGAYYDITSDSVIANWWDNTTRLPKDIGASGTAGGALATPLIYVRGMAGDYILGKNYGSGGDLHAQVPLSQRDAGFVDVDL
jgi:hypothetical protein|nr:MAG TPA_asm: hypothetical protein [Caudoviricetes sp.]